MHDFARFESFLESFHAQHGEDAIAVLVMHSWSLLEMDRAAGHFTGPNDKSLEKFADFLFRVRATHDIVTMPEVAAAADSGSLLFDWHLDTTALDGGASGMHYPGRITYKPAAESPACNADSNI